MAAARHLARGRACSMPGSRRGPAVPRAWPVGGADRPAPRSPAIPRGRGPGRALHL